MNRVIIRLVGGLGNQLFQYTTARAVAFRNGSDLLLDIREFSNDNGKWRYSLHHFNINARIAKISELPPPRTARFRYNLWRLFGNNPKFVRERGLGFNSKLMTIGTECYLHGYFQSETYFTNIADLVRNELRIITPPNAANTKLLSTLSNETTVSLHIRRGDYLSTNGTGTFATCGLDYYTTAISYLARQIGSIVIYVFSDDPDWARDNLLSDYPIIILDQNSGNLDYEDLRLMSACQHNIISNSTFSWWGAWLNPNPGKIVIAPYNWFASGHPVNPDIIPSNWVIIAN